MAAAGAQAVDHRPQIGVEVYPINTRDAREIERAVAAFAGGSNSGLIVTGSASAQLHRDPIVTLAARYKLPAVYSNRFFVTGGGLISYGPDFVDQYRRAAGYAAWHTGQVRPLLLAAYRRRGDRVSAARRRGRSRHAHSSRRACSGLVSCRSVSSRVFRLGSAGEKAKPKPEAKKPVRTARTRDSAAASGGWFGAWPAPAWPSRATGHQLSVTRPPINLAAPQAR
jgi:hypothetical protein